MSLLDEIEPLKAEALAALTAVSDQSSLDSAKGAYLGPQGKFTGLLKQLGTLPKEERPAVGKAINMAKGELEKALKVARDKVELGGAGPDQPVDFTAPGRCRRSGRLHPLTQVTEDIVRSAAIADLETRYPGIKERLLDDDGEVRRFVNVYVNEEDIRFLDNQATALKDGDELSIIPAIAGG